MFHFKPGGPRNPKRMDILLKTEHIRVLEKLFHMKKGPFEKGMTLNCVTYLINLKA